MEIKKQTIEKFLEELSSKAPTPGGGAVAAVAGAMAAALVSMVAKLSVNKNEDFKEIEEKAEKLREELLELADEDCQAFERVMKAYRLPKESNKQQEIRNKEIQEALKKAAETPLKTAKKSVEVLKMASFCAQKGNQNAVSDARAGIELATAAVYGALENVRINLESIKDEKFYQRIKEEIEEILGCEDLKTG
jgi:formiminotetrahydrofolate cyclodeaminase